MLDASLHALWQSLLFAVQWAHAVTSAWPPDSLQWQMQSFNAITETMVSLLQNVSILLKLKVLICVRIKQRIHGDTFWKKTWTCCVFHLPRQTFKSKRDKDDLCLLLLASWKDTALMEKKRTTGVIDGCRGFNVDCCKELQLSCDALGPTKCMDLL